MIFASLRWQLFPQFLERQRECTGFSECRLDVLRFWDQVFVDQIGCELSKVSIVRCPQHKAVCDVRAVTVGIHTSRGCVADVVFFGSPTSCTFSEFALLMFASVM
jgi:hypothetical protein